MLTQINISNFAIIKNLDLELTAGMTVITGETGAGKSIVIDALDIALGDRADPQLIRQGAERCEISLAFDVSNIARATAWLDEHDLAADDDCIIRRTLSREGRSKSFINGRPVTLAQLRALTQHLVNIHSQHQHHALLQKDAQRRILDRLTQNPELLQKVRIAFTEWQSAKSKLEQHLATQIDDAKLALLQYQVQELDDLAPNETEWETLIKHQQQLSHSETIQDNLQTCLDQLENENQYGIHSSLYDIEQRLRQVARLLGEGENCISLIQNAIIQLTEATDEIKTLLTNVDCDPESLQQIEQRVSALHNAARKHHVNPEALVTKHQELTAQLLEFTDCEQITANLQQQVSITWKTFYACAQQLHQARQTTAKKLAKQITQSIRTLGMPQGQCVVSVEFDESQPSLHGMDRVEFQVSTNPGQKLMNMAKVASGGELSRISLAIQVITAEQNNTPTLVFDEVDVGISGATAEIVGKLLQQLGKTAQILCITHLAQVAAQGQQHIKIDKKVSGRQTVSELKHLNHNQRIEEIARMVGGVKITQQTLAHAEELLTSEG